MNVVPRLPRCVTKYELATYFECSYEYLWKEIITDELLEGWNYSYEEHVRPCKKLHPILTKKIYLHFGIRDLDMSLADEIALELGESES